MPCTWAFRQKLIPAKPNLVFGQENRPDISPLALRLGSNPAHSWLGHDFLHPPLFLQKQSVKVLSLKFPEKIKKNISKVSKQWKNNGCSYPIPHNFQPSLSSFLWDPLQLQNLSTEESQKSEQAHFPSSLLPLFDSNPRTKTQLLHTHTLPSQPSKATTLQPQAQTWLFDCWVWI